MENMHTDLRMQRVDLFLIQCIWEVLRNKCHGIYFDPNLVLIFNLTEMNLVASSLTKLLLSYLLPLPECILHMYIKCLLTV